MTIDGFTRMVGFLEGAYRHGMEENQRDAWWEIVERLDDTEVFEAAKSYVRSSPTKGRFPTPGEVLDYCYRLRLQGRQSIRQSREEATPVTAEEAKAFIERMRKRLAGQGGRSC